MCKTNKFEFSCYIFNCSINTMALAKYVDADTGTIRVVFEKGHDEIEVNEYTKNEYEEIIDSVGDDLHYNSARALSKVLSSQFGVSV